MMSHRYWALALVTAMALAHAGPASAQTGLVAAYGFNEGAGTTAADASGNTNTGTLSGATWNAAGRYGSALSFDGSNDWVTIADKSVLDLTSAMTVEAWVYASSSSGWRTVLLKEGSAGLSYALYSSDAGSRPSGWIRRTSDIDATGTSAIATNTWVHLAATYNGSTLTLYVNGVQAATRAITGAIVTSTLPLRIGGSAAWGEYFAGRIDEVRIYNRALSASEIQTDMNTPVGAAGPTPDFSLSTAPASQTVTQGNTANYTVTIGAVNGFSGIVNLSASGLPANTTATFSPTTVTGGGSATMTVTTGASTPTGSRTLTITGASGALTRTATVGLVVTGAPTPDFTVSSTPGSQTVTQGGVASYTVTIGAVNGFSGPVTLSTSGLPAEATASFNPATVTGAGSTTLTITTAGDTPPGSSTLTITGTSGALSRTATASLTVTSPFGFTVAATPGSRTLVQGGSTSYTVSVDALNGFNSTVTLNVTGLPANASAAFAPTTITGSGSATLTVTTATGTPVGTSTLTINGTSGSLIQSTTADLVVSAATAGRAVGIHFVGTGTSMGAAESAGVVPKSNWNNATGSSRTTGLALVDETGALSGATVIWSSSGTSQTPITDQAGNRRLMKGHLNTTSTSVTSRDRGWFADRELRRVRVRRRQTTAPAPGQAPTESAAPGSRPRRSTSPTRPTPTSAAHSPRPTNSNGNYVKFTVTASGFTLTATPVGTFGTRRAPVNAVQIVPTRAGLFDILDAELPNGDSGRSHDLLRHDDGNERLRGHRRPDGDGVAGQRDGHVHSRFCDRGGNGDAPGDNGG